MICIFVGTEEQIYTPISVSVAANTNQQEYLLINYRLNPMTNPIQVPHIPDKAILAYLKISVRIHLIKKGAKV